MESMTGIKGSIPREPKIKGENLPEDIVKARQYQYDLA